METLLPAAETRPASLQDAIPAYCEMQAQELQQNHPGSETQAVANRMRANYDLLEPVGENKPQVEPAAMTVCIPVALMHEDQSTIDRVLDNVHRSQEELGQPVEVILWTNTPDNSGVSGKSSLRRRVQERRATAKITQRYQGLRDSLHRFDDSDMRIKTALKVMPSNSTSISKIRSDYMEAATIDALENGYDSDYPVLWLDADTTYISKNTLPAIQEKVKAGDSLFVHTQERYTTEWADGIPPSQTDDATRAIKVSEIQRRKLTKAAAKAGVTTQYPEESGLAFSLDTYLKLGGVNTTDPISEAGHLVKYGKELLLNGQIDRRSPSFPANSTPLPRTVAGVIEYVPGARMGLSARRQYKAVKEHGAIGIRRSEGVTEYTLFADNQSEPKQKTKDASPINRADMHQELEAQQRRHMRRSQTHLELEEKDSRIIAKMIDKAFED